MFEDEVVTFYIRQRQLNCDVVMFWKTTFDYCEVSVCLSVGEAKHIIQLTHYTQGHNTVYAVKGVLNVINFV